MDRQPPTPKLPYYPRFVQDWASSPKVRAMRTFAERGLYCELLDLQWQEGSLPAETEACHEALGLGTAEEFASAWTRVEHCFPIGKDGRRRNRRLEIERAKAMRLVEVRRSSGKQRSSKSAGRQELQAHAEQTSSIAKQTSSNAQLSEIEIEIERKRGSSPGIDLLGDLDPSSQARALPDSKSGRPRAKGKRSKQQEPEGFAEFYAAFPIHVARIDAAKAFREKIDDGTIPPHPDLLAAVASYARWLQLPDAPNPCYPATWLRGGRWTDEHARLRSGTVPIVDLRTAFLNPNGGTKE